MSNASVSDPYRAYSFNPDEGLSSDGAIFFQTVMHEQEYLEDTNLLQATFVQSFLGEFEGRGVRGRDLMSLYPLDAQGGITYWATGLGKNRTDADSDSKIVRVDFPHDHVSRTVGPYAPALRDDFSKRLGIAWMAVVLLGLFWGLLGGVALGTGFLLSPSAVLMGVCGVIVLAATLFVAGLRRRARRVIVE